MTVSEFLARFEGRSRTGDQWLVRCPAHEDRKPSLAVREGSAGRIVLKCHAGCATEAVLQAMGLTSTDLFADRQNGSRREVAVYDYVDERGTLLYQVVRTDPKGFFQRRPDGRGGWINSLGDVRRVLFALPQLQGRQVVYVAEGEKDALALQALGLAATTNAAGAGKWRGDYTQQLKAAGAKSVVVLPDNDDAGRSHAHAVAASCHEAGMSVKIVALPDVPAKGDVSDYLLAGHGREDLLALVRATAVYQPQAHGAAPESTFGPVVKCVADVQSEKVSWLWRRRFARGKLTLLMGDPGVGKSFITIDATSRITRGGTWPDGERVATAGNVLFLAVEDGIGDTIRPRLERAGADVSRVFVLTTIREERGERMLNFEHDIAELEQVIVERKPVLVVVDPISSYLGKSDSYKDTDIRRVLTPLAVLAEKHKVALVALVHMTKGSKDGKALYRAMGSIAFAALARVVLAAGADPEQSDRCYLMPVKQNVCPPSATLAYRLQSDPDDEDAAALLQWEAAAVEGIRADEILGTALTSDERSQRRSIVEFLQELLSDGRMMAADEALKACRANGYSESTVNRHKQAAGVKTVKGAFRGGWFWQLVPKATTHGEVTPFADNVPISSAQSGTYSKIVTARDLATFGGEDDTEAGLV